MGRRQAFTLIELLVVIAVIAILVALLVPAVQKIRCVAARTQSTNNLKQCALAAHAYHDTWKYLPFNGVASATSADNTSGAWPYQVLPYVDQQALYDSQPADGAMSVPVPAYLCAIRGRPGYYTGSGTSAAVTGLYSTSGYEIGPGESSGTPFTANPTFTINAPGPSECFISVNGPVSITINNVGGSGNTATFYQGGGEVGYTFGTVVVTSLALPGASNSGPATDFAINVFLNDPTGGVNSPNVYRQLDTISDGTSNTILLGHAYVQTIVYPSTTPVASSLLPIFTAGTLATGRNTLGNTAATWLQDGAATTSNQWGSPMPEGGLIAMADGAVRLFSYATPLTDFLLPDDGNPVELP